LDKTLTGGATTRLERKAEFDVAADPQRMGGPDAIALISVFLISLRHLPCSNDCLDKVLPAL
jgi:hypothetical protein